MVTYGKLSDDAALLLHVCGAHLDAVKAVAVGDVIHQQDALRAPKVAGGDGPKALLPRRVPNLRKKG